MYSSTLTTIMLNIGRIYYPHDYYRLLVILLVSFSSVLLVEAITSEIISSECRDLESIFINCKYNASCVYGEPNSIECQVDNEIPCKGDHNFEVTFPCLYCWQLPESQYTCLQNTTCKPETRYITTCTTNQATHCLGSRTFRKYKRCDYEGGHRWSLALALSVMSGGFGIDRFYLGYLREGVSKLFSFGGFGVWTLIDAILIAIGYLKPADSPRYEL